MSAADFIASLAERGRYHFSTQEAAQGLNSNLVAARAALRRLKRKGAVAAPYRGFHVIVPAEYRRIGCLPAEQFIPQLMGHLGLAYYVALLSAGRYHGAAHQQPQVFQVMVAKKRPPLACGDVRVGYVARKNVAEVPTVHFNTPRGQIRVATTEATALELVGYVRHAGGLGNVATVLTELSEMMNPEQLAAVALLSPIPWAQRLGYLLSLQDTADAIACADALADYVARFAGETVAFVPGRAVANAPRDARWKLELNASVEPDL